LKRTALVILAAAALGACAPEPAERLVPADYRAWARVPRQPLRYAVPGHLDSARVVYINPTGLAAARTASNAPASEFPEGTIIVKEVFPGLQADVSATPRQLTVMIKRPGHKLARGGWLWVTRDPAAGTERIIDYELCYDCHAAANEPHPYADRNPSGQFRDFVFLPYGLMQDAER
jgi:hypothetical protein